MKSELHVTLYCVRTCTPTHTQSQFIPSVFTFYSIWRSDIPVTFQDAQHTKSYKLKTINAKATIFRLSILPCFHVEHFSMIAGNFTFNFTIVSHIYRGFRSI
jgi:hypothetical protein